MVNVLNDAYQIVNTDATILITGESGTGKEVLAQFIHQNSKRKSHKLITLNCASIPSSILSSELFGHEKGAFTGALSRRKGKFREADGGTLFLDEIGDMPLELQATLLRAIEYGKVSPLGIDSEVDVDVRLIAATNKELEYEVETGCFRMDLFYRLNVITIKIPALRKRPEDILPLARYYIDKASLDHKKRLSASTIRLLQNYEWPGNVRELANAMKRAAVLSRTELIMPDHLPPSIKSKTCDENQNPKKNSFYREEIKTIEESEIATIKNALTATNGNQTQAAKVLKISRKTLINKIKKYQI